jgi:formylglycine-generating enzyme required for sulfatase activity
MGDDRSKESSPKRKVYLDAFFIDKYEVTNAEYGKYCKATGHSAPRYWPAGQMPTGRENHPVVCVNWTGAMEYANWAGKRLPTEAEWEKAARGTDGRCFPWGNDWSSSRCNSGARLSKHGFNPNVGRRGWLTAWEKWAKTKTGEELMAGGGYTTPVGSFADGASPYGCMDMAGNVTEWCNDGYLDTYYRTAPDRNPPGPNNKAYIVLRGGSWICPSHVVECAYRGMAGPGESNVYIGFRCAKNAP